MTCTTSFLHTEEPVPFCRTHHQPMKHLHAVVIDGQTVHVWVCPSDEGHCEFTACGPFEPGDFIKSKLDGFWTGIVISRKDLLNGKLPGYAVRLANGRTDWICHDDAILVAPALEGEAGQ